MRHRYIAFATPLFLITFLLLQFHAQGQDVRRELGIRTNSFENFGAIYKWQKSEDVYGRLSAAALDISAGLNPARVGTSFSMAIGREKRKLIAEKTDWLRGLQWGLGASYFDTESNSGNFAIGAQIAYLLGLQYQASSRFNVGLEFLPSLNFNYHIDPDVFTVSADVDFSNVFLFGTYKFSSASKTARGK